MVATRQPLFRKAARVTRLGVPSLEMHNRAGTRCRANDIPRRTSRTIAQRSSAVFLMLPLVASLGGCASLRLNPDPEVAPSGNVDRVWAPPLSITNANEAASKLEPLRSLDENNRLRASGAHAYDLPALVDLALRTNPQTRRAWYAAQAANAEFGESQASNYPQITADGEGGYLKLPIQFPGQTLVIRNEAFLPQIKVSYDLLDFARTRASARSAREQLIAANFAFNRAIQDVVFDVEKAYYVLSAAKACVSAAEANLKLARTSLGAVHERHQMGLATSRKFSWRNKSRRRPFTISRTPSLWSTTLNPVSARRSVLPPT